MEKIHLANLEIKNLRLENSHATQRRLECVRRIWNMNMN